ncbi:hypothetical protein GCWU000324_02471 [Kingella oralis ATCC 51147]|uniref:Uncharacterized protein n=1 Tax=Kingella oralis ATCC 51147 TaxID=629741 RepID=C4GK97_9NEIS|nr:hypothetical protein GCWU000324_02471 [Kingella oralis ATCC 51147]
MRNKRQPENGFQRSSNRSEKRFWLHETPFQAALMLFGFQRVV